MKNILILIFSFLQGFVLCQTNNFLYSDSLIKQNHFSININPFFTSKIKYDNKGADLIRSKNLICGEIGFGFNRQINDKWSLQTSLNIGLMPYNFNFEFEAPENSIFQTGPYKEYYKILDFNWSEYRYIRLYSNIDAIFSRQICSLKNKDKILLGGGIRTFVFFVDDYDYEYTSTWDIDENNPYVNLFYARINDTIPNRFKISLLLEASYLKSLKNKHQIKSTIFLNYSPFKNVEGNYTFSNLGFSSSGTFSQNLTYMGFRFNYFIPIKSKQRISLNGLFNADEKI